VVRFILEEGVEIEARGGRGGATPLNIASFRGHVDVVKLLLEHGADPEAVDEAVFAVRLGGLGLKCTGMCCFF